MTVIVSIVPQESTWDGATYDSDWSGTDEIVTITVMQPNGVPRDYDIDDCITIEATKASIKERIGYSENMYYLGERDGKAFTEDTWVYVTGGNIIHMWLNEMGEKPRSQTMTAPKPKVRFFLADTGGKLEDDAPIQPQQPDAPKKCPLCHTSSCCSGAKLKLPLTRL